MKLIPQPIATPYQAAQPDFHAGYPLPDLWDGSDVSDGDRCVSPIR